MAGLLNSQLPQTTRLLKKQTTEWLIKKCQTTSLHNPLGPPRSWVPGSEMDSIVVSYSIYYYALVWLLTHFVQNSSSMNGCRIEIDTHILHCAIRNANLGDQICWFQVNFGLASIRKQHFDRWFASKSVSNHIENHQNLYHFISESVSSDQ